jgi:antidote-toxin recognition MazE-like antitoxin
MPSSTRPKASRDKVRAYRRRLRRQGLRPIQIWVPDVRSPAFRAEAHRQSLAVARSSHEKADQEYVDAISEWNEE